MSGMLVWAVILFLSGLALLILEAFIPSGGLLGVLAFACLATSVILGYVGHWVEGTIILGAAVIGVPLAVVLMLKYWPDTPIGRRVLLGVPGEQEVLPDVTQRKSLIGKRGRAQSVMLPAGPVSIDGEVIDAVSEGMVIEAGQLVEVVRAGTLDVVVRAVEEEEPKPEAASGDDLLSQPVDALDPEPSAEATTAQDKPEPKPEPKSSPAAKPVAEVPQHTSAETDAEEPAAADAELEDDDVFSQQILLEDDEEDSEAETM